MLVIAQKPIIKLFIIKRVFVKNPHSKDIQNYHKFIPRVSNQGVFIRTNFFIRI